MDREKHKETFRFKIGNFLNLKLLPEPYKVSATISFFWFWRKLSIKVIEAVQNS